MNNAFIGYGKPIIADIIVDELERRGVKFKRDENNQIQIDVLYPFGKRPRRQISRTIQFGGRVPPKEFALANEIAAILVPGKSYPLLQIISAFTSRGYKEDEIEDNLRVLIRSGIVE